MTPEDLLELRRMSAWFDAILRGATEDRARIDELEAAVDGLAMAETHKLAAASRIVELKKGLLAKDAEIAQLKKRIESLEGDLGGPLTTTNAKTDIIYTGNEGEPV